MLKVLSNFHLITLMDLGDHSHEFSRPLNPFATMRIIVDSGIVDAYMRLPVAIKGEEHST